MAKVITDNRHYTQIANQLRYYSSDVHALLPEQMPKAISDTCMMMYNNGKSDGYGKGFSEGTEKAKAMCAQMHFAGSVVGSDTEGFHIPIPFCPDMIQVYTTHPFGNQYAGTYLGFAIDMRSGGKLMGDILYHDQNGNMGSVRLRTYFKNLLFSYTDGVFSFQPMEGQLPGVLWRSNVRYFVMATCFPNDSTPFLIAEQIRTLPDAVPEGNSGALTFHKDTVDLYFSEQQWAYLTGLKPQWTFVLE